MPKPQRKDLVDNEIHKSMLEMPGLFWKQAGLEAIKNGRSRNIEIVWLIKEALEARKKKALEESKVEVKLNP